MTADNQVDENLHDSKAMARLYRHWGIALAVSVVNGALFALFAGDNPPVPVPGEASPMFWIGWGPLTAISIVAFMAAVAPEAKRVRWYGAAAGAAVVAGVISALVAWGRIDDAAYLLALHLPFVAWAIVGGSVTLGRPEQARNFYSFIVQSLEVLVTSGIYLGAGGVFGGLTIGVFAVLGLELPEDVAISLVAFGIGIIPVLAVASVFDPTRAPVEQSPTGLARIFRIMTWLMLPVALGVMVLYVFWFIPNYFWRPFNEREVLIVYNATIIAILALMAGAVSAGNAHLTSGYQRPLRAAVVWLGALTLSLNVYALAAIISRISEFGFTVNRHAVLGWNAVTLLMLAFLLAKSWSAAAADWLPAFRGSLAQAMVLAVGWAAWVVWGLPLF